jgi:hypothetical protein
VSGYKYYLVIIDDYSHYTWTFPLCLKSDTFTTISNFFAHVRTQFGASVKAVQCDNGREFDNSSARTFFLSHGAILCMSCPHTSQQNGKAEHTLRTVNNIVRSLLFQSSLPPVYWVESLNTATYLLNRHPTKTLGGLTPFFALYDTYPDYTHLRVFGCACYPNLSATATHKLSPRSSLCVFLGYSFDHKVYRCLDLHSNRIIISRHVTFDESVFPFSNMSTSASDPSTLDFLSNDDDYAIFPKSSTTAAGTRSGASSPAASLLPTVELDSSSGSPGAPSSPASPSMGNPGTPSTPEIGTGRSTTTSPGGPVMPDPVAPVDTLSQVAASRAERVVAQSVVPVINDHGMRTRGKSGFTQPIDRLNLHAGTLSRIPTSICTSLTDPRWRAAMQAEFDALQANDTWELVPRPPGINLVTGKWIFRHNFFANGSLDRYKARWVLRGFTQRPGIDYDETFSPVVKPATVRVVLTLALSRSWPIHQLDVKNAFLHGTLNETVYSEQPSGFVDPSRPKHVCRLNKSLYGLKQAPRAWHLRIAGHLLSLGFVESKADSSLFIYRRGADTAFLLLYVDDIVLTTSAPRLLQRIIAALQQEFSMTDMGPLHHFLGLSVERRVDVFFSLRSSICWIFWTVLV